MPKILTASVHWFVFSSTFLLPYLVPFNRSSRKKRDMALNPLFIKPDLFAFSQVWRNFPVSFKPKIAIPEFLWKMQRRTEPGIPSWGWTPWLFPLKTCCWVLLWMLQNNLDLKKIMSSVYKCAPSELIWTHREDTTGVPFRLFFRLIKSGQLLIFLVLITTDFYFWLVTVVII